MLVLCKKSLILDEELYTKNKWYKVVSYEENSDAPYEIEANQSIEYDNLYFKKNDGYPHYYHNFFEYFYDNKELRKIKLEKIRKIRKLYPLGYMKKNRIVDNQ